MAMYEQQRLPMALGSARQFAPVSYIAEGAKRYAEERGRSYSSEGLDQVQMDSRRGFALAKEYERNERGPVPSRTMESYEALRRETRDQYDFLTRPSDQGGMGVSVEVTDHDPYDSPQALAADLEQRRIKVLSTKSTGGHAFFSDEENDQFRAVHDVFGHAGIGRGFSRHGEEAAYRSHAQMFSPGATEALTGETRGQNSYLNNLGRGFPDNGTVPMPSWAAETGPFKGVPGQRTAKIRPQGTQGTLF